MLKAVVFDMDGVITDSAAYHFQAWKNLADKLRIPFDEEYNEKLKGVSRLESLNLILDNGPGRDSLSEEEKAVLTDEKNENYKELIKQITPDDLLPGIEKLLYDLKREGILIALASVSKNAPFILEKLQVSQCFDYIADASKIERSKPFPDIFLDCIHALKVPASDAVGIEDAEAGIEAIHAAGMRAVGVGNKDSMHAADMILPGTRGLSVAKLKTVCL